LPPVATAVILGRRQKHTQAYTCGAVSNLVLIETNLFRTVTHAVHAVYSSRGVQLDPPIRAAL